MKLPGRDTLISACMFVAVAAGAPAAAQTPCGSVAQCAQRAVEAATAADASVKVMQAKLDALEKVVIGFGGGRILGIAHVKGNVLITKSAGLSYDTGTNEITFPNPGNLPFVPVVTMAQESPHITTTVWVPKIGGANTFTVKGNTMDTTGRGTPPNDFTAVIIGFAK